MIDVLYAVIIGLLVGFIIGVVVTVMSAEKDFDGEYRKAKYEWKLNKEKEKQNEQ